MKKIEDKRGLIIRIVLSILILFLGILSFVFEGHFENILSDGVIDNINNSGFKMYAINVGQGDAIYLEFPDNTNMLIDCGREDTAQEVVKFLNNKKVREINYFIYTHADEDHIGGGKLIFETYKVDILYRPKILCKTEAIAGNLNGYNIKDTDSYDDAIMSAYAEENCSIKYSFEGENIIGENYKIRFLNPNEDNYSDSNDYSAVLMISVYDIKILLQGDADEGVETRLIESYGSSLDVDILKVSHHGSRTGTSDAFLELTTPKIAIISVGENSWGMPNVDVLERLNRIVEDKIFITLYDGTIALGINENKAIFAIGENNIKRRDFPLLISILLILMILVWGIKFPKKEEKK